MTYAAFKCGRRSAQSSHWDAPQTLTPLGGATNQLLSQVKKNEI